MRLRGRTGEEGCIKGKKKKKLGQGATRKAERCETRLR